MAQAIASKPDKLSSIPGTHKMEGESQLENYPLISMCVLWHTCTRANIGK